MAVTAFITFSLDTISFLCTGFTELISLSAKLYNEGKVKIGDQLSPWPSGECARSATGRSTV